MVFLISASKPSAYFSMGLGKPDLKKRRMMEFQAKFLASKNTIPQRLTVAGLACYKSSTSNIIVIQRVRRMVSYEVRQSFLLSSSTVFIFSIQTASTGPSNTTHLRSGISPMVASSRIILGKTPSVHVFVSLSKRPYNCQLVMLLGFNLNVYIN
jgi:hypothetical protein